MTIKTLFALKYSENQLTVKFICVISQKNNNKVYTVQNNEVYNVLHHHHAGELFAGEYYSHCNDYVHHTSLHDKRPQINTYFHITPYSSIS